MFYFFSMIAADAGAPATDPSCSLRAPGSYLRLHGTVARTGGAVTRTGGAAADTGGVVTHTGGAALDTGGVRESIGEEPEGVRVTRTGSGRIVCVGAWRVREPGVQDMGEWARCGRGVARVRLHV